MLFIPFCTKSEKVDKGYQEVLISILRDILTVNLLGSKQFKQGHLYFGVVIYPTAVYASCDIGPAYPTAVYTRFISLLAYPTAMYIRSVLVYPYFNYFLLELTLLKCNNKLNKFNSESGPWPISDYSKKFLKN